MKIILVGYPGSQKIRKASEYLINKYIKGYEIKWLVYDGKIDGWAKFVASFLKGIPDEKVIFALDDYLIAGPLQFFDANLGEAVCAKLCYCTPEENEEYPITTQYTLWNKKYLIELLEQVGTPWEFELRGSRLFKLSDKKMVHRPVLKYFTNSSLSAKWDGVRLDGLSEEDVKEVQKCIL